MPDFDGFANQYGLLAAAIFYFLYRELWPWLRDKVVPSAAAASKSKQADQQRREDRLIAVLEQHARTSAALETTLEQIGQQLQQHSVVLQQLTEDLAGLYGQIGLQRPSRRRPNEAAPVGPTK
jgi:hypothetical protein